MAATIRARLSASGLMLVVVLILSFAI
jgi:hypothetical protein